MSKKHKKRFSRLSAVPLRVKVWVIAGVLGVVSIVALVWYLIVINQPQQLDEIDDLLSASQKIQRDARVEQAQRDEALLEKAGDAIKNGDTEAAEDVYKNAIASEKEAERKVQLAIDQARLLYSAGKVADANRVSKEAESYGSDQFLIAEWSSRMYEDQKKYVIAAEYYSLAAKWADSETNKLRYDAQYYKTQAARVIALEKQ